ncbi:Acyl-protein thioesterase 1 [Cytospora mali]|uniref:Acyl-protein thioesterase 1 n=1 Tax=Cytospora mali TaxID=578113 RepID=A0A194W5P1_CYTMA|nr:Acyl-protein thioesterase 1 [Valsa mali]
MPVEASFPEPLVVEPVSGIHKHTIILLHGRGGSTDTFGPPLLNTCIFTNSQEPEEPVRRGQTAEDSDIHSSTTPGLTPTSEPLSPNVTTDHAPLADPPWNPPLALQPPSKPSYHQETPPRQHAFPTTLAEALPHARFVFPNAPRQRATVYKRSIIRQWFDDWHLRPELSGDHVNDRYDEGLQTSGLGDTVRYLHELVAKEAELVGGVRNVVLGGISQGCAVSLVAALLWEGDDRLGAVVGMCGWLPYLSQMKEAVQVQEDAAEGAGEEGDELFERAASPQTSPAAIGSAGVAVSWLCDELELPTMQGSELLSAECRKTPVGLYHGCEDKKVDRSQGKLAADFLLTLGMEVWHWKSQATLGDSNLDSSGIDAAKSSSLVVGEGVHGCLTNVEARGGMVNGKDVDGPASVGELPAGAALSFPH